MNYLSGIVVVAIGVILGFFTKDVNSILQWIVSGLYGGYIAANVLKWYWWRFNANGFFWGMLAGIAGALVFSRFFDGIQFLYFFPLLFLISIIGCLAGTYSAPPTETGVLKSFYKTVRLISTDTIVSRTGFVQEVPAFWYIIFLCKKGR